MIYLRHTYLCDLFFNFSFIFIFINHLTTCKQTHLFFVHFLEYLLLFLDDNVDEESEESDFFFEIAKIQPQGVA